jgi:hypothetical protein
LSTPVARRDYPVRLFVASACWTSIRSHFLGKPADPANAEVTVRPNTRTSPTLAERGRHPVSFMLSQTARFERAHAAAHSLAPWPATVPFTGTAFFGQHGDRKFG